MRRLRLGSLLAALLVVAVGLSADSCNQTNNSSGSGSNSGGGTNTATDFTLGLTVTWHHVGPGNSNVVVCVDTVPATSGVAVTANGTGPGGTTLKGSGTTDASGKAQINQPITQYGQYHESVSGTKGTHSASKSGDVTVTSTQGTPC
jgi:hypothetical protein